MKYLESTIKRLDGLYDRVLAELNLELLLRVKPFLEDMNGRVTPYTGFRNEHDQEVAFHTGASDAHFKDSPHNFSLPLGALAVDVVLNPAHVSCPPHPEDADYPWLWATTTPDTQAVWNDVERLAAKHRLGRVNVDGKRDAPHLQLDDWRERVKAAAS